MSQLSPLLNLDKEERRQVEIIRMSIVQGQGEDCDDDDSAAGDGVDGLGEERGDLGEDGQGHRSEAESCLWGEGDFLAKVM